MPALSNRKRMSRLIIAAAVVAVVVVPAACKKESTAPQLQVATNTTLPVNSTITSAVTGTSFSFPGGAGVLAPEVANQNLTVSFAGTSTAPTAALAITTTSGGSVGTATANLTFGSCIFAITVSTFPPGSRLAVGQVIVVNPCNINVNTAGQQANGVGATRSVALQLGAASSSGQPITVNVNPGGQLTLNGTSVGTVTLVPVSG